MKPTLLALTLTLAFTAACAQQRTPLFSEDFESGAIDPHLWTQQVTGENTISVQQAKAAHGKYALLVRCPAPAQGTYAFLVAHGLSPALQHHHFGRAYVYITPGLPDRHTVFLTAGTAGFPKNKYQEVATAHARFQLTYVDGIGGGEDFHSAGQVPIGRWFLLEWEFNDQPDQAAVWVDGEKVFDTPFTFHTVGPSTDLVGSFTDVSFGFRLWGAAPQPFDIYYDDIAIDTARIGPVAVPVAAK